MYNKLASVIQQLPHKCALKTLSGDVTFSQLDELINKQCEKLIHYGVTKDHIVAISTADTTLFVSITYAIWKLGACLLPLNHAISVDETKTYLKEAGAFLYVGDYVDSLSDNICQHAVSHNQWETTPAHDNRNIAYCDDVTDNPAVIMFSSGSTGQPKQVVRSYRNLYCETAGVNQSTQVSSADTIFCCIPLFHSHGFGNAMLSALQHGATLYLYRGEFNARKIVKELASSCATVVPIVPFMIKIMQQTRFKESPNLQHVRLMFTAGAPLERDTILSFQEKFNILLGQLYGSTETGAVSLNAQPSMNNVSSVGLPFPHMTVAIERNDSEKYGEILVSSDANTTEYIGQTELSAQVFDGSCYHSGDVGYLDAEGYLYITGRTKLMINVAGNKVDPADVEKTILSMDEVDEVVVLAKPHAVTGETVKAAICLKPGSTIQQEDVIKYCRERLIDYKCPSIIAFIDEIPRSPLGKVLRKYL